MRFNGVSKAGRWTTTRVLPGGLSSKIGHRPAPRLAHSSAPEGGVRASEEADVPDRTRLEALRRQRLADDSLVVRAVTLRARGSEHSIIGELTSWRHRGRTGLFHYRLDLGGRDGERTLDVVTKIKPADRELIEVAEAVADICDGRLGRTLRRHRDRIGFRGAHLRELALYAETGRTPARPHACLLRHVAGREPRRVGPRAGAAGGRGSDGCHGGPAVLDGRARERGARRAGADPGCLVRTGGPPREPTVDRPCQHDREHGRHDAAVAGARRPRDAVSHRVGRRLDGPEAARARRVGRDWWPSLEASPRTLIHNDFSPRNVAIRDVGGSLRLRAYDWELATLGAPQCDLAHFLCFVLDPDASREQIALHVERHRAALAGAAGTPIDPGAWEAGFGAALADLLINRLMFYVMIHRVRPL